MTVTEERETVKTCKVLQELGFGLTRETVSKVISDFLRDSARPSPFTGGLPGPDWWVGFMQRWPTLSERKPQHLSLVVVLSQLVWHLLIWMQYPEIVSFLRS